MRVDIRDEADVTVMALAGAFNAAASASATQYFCSLLEAGKRNIVLELENVDFIDSVGLGTLVQWFKKVRIGEGDLRLAKVQRPVLRVLELTRLDRVFTIVSHSEA